MKQKINTRLLWVACGVLCFVIYGVLSGYTKTVLIYSDELIYFDLAKSIFKGEGLVVRREEFAFHQILYSLALVPTFLIKSAAVQTRVIGWLNAFYMSLSFFPAYGIASLLTKEEKQLRLSAVTLLFFPTFINSCSMMSEVLYLPLTLLVVYLVLKILHAEGYRILLWNAVLAISFAFIYTDKAVSLYLICGYAVLVIYSVISYSKNRFYMLGGFAICMGMLLGGYLIYKYGVMGANGNSYVNFLGLFHIQWNRMGYTLYAIFNNMILMTLALGFFPVIMPILGWKKMKNASDKKFYVFLYSSILIVIFVISYLINSVEDYGNDAMRVHVRYFEPMIWVYLVALFGQFEALREAWIAKMQIRTMILLIYSALFVAFGHNGIYFVDNTVLSLYGTINDRLSEWMNWEFGVISVAFIVQVVIRVGISLLVVLASYIICKKERNLILRSFMITYAVIQVLNISIQWNERHKTQNIASQVAPAYEQLDVTIADLNGELLVINCEVDGYNYMKCFDTFIRNDFYNTELYSLFLKNQIRDGMIDLEQESIVSRYPCERYYTKLSQVDYIMAPDFIAFEHVELMEEEIVPHYNLYLNLNPTQIFFADDVSVYFLDDDGVVVIGNTEE